MAHNTLKSKQERDPVVPTQGVNQCTQLGWLLLLTVKSILRGKLSNHFSINQQQLMGYLLQVAINYFVFEAP